MRDPDCIFCKIIEGKVPASKVYEDGDVLAFLDIMPVNKGHTLVIPKEHYENLLEMPEGSMAKCMAAAKKVAAAVMEGARSDGFNIGMNNYTAAGQAVMHAHFHVIPRHNDDGLRHWPQGRYYDDSERDEMAQSIAEHIKDTKDDKPSKEDKPKAAKTPKASSKKAK